MIFVVILGVIVGYHLTNKIDTKPIKTLLRVFLGFIGFIITSFVVVIVVL